MKAKRLIVDCGGGVKYLSKRKIQIGPFTCDFQALYPECKFYPQDWFLGIDSRKYDEQKFEDDQFNAIEERIAISREMRVANQQQKGVRI